MTLTLSVCRFSPHTHTHALVHTHTHRHPKTPPPPPLCLFLGRGAEELDALTLTDQIRWLHKKTNLLINRNYPFNRDIHFFFFLQLCRCFWMFFLTASTADDTESRVTHNPYFSVRLLILRLLNIIHMKRIKKKKREIMCAIIRCHIAHSA